MIEVSILGSSKNTVYNITLIAHEGSDYLLES